MGGRFLQPPADRFFLFGPRGTSKSTWLQQQFPQALRLDLLAAEVLRAYQARPERLRERITADEPGLTTVVIDEVQKAPQLLDVVHSLVEERPELRFVLTGSFVCPQAAAWRCRSAWCPWRGKQRTPQATLAA